MFRRALPAVPPVDRPSVLARVAPYAVVGAASLLLAGCLGYLSASTHVSVTVPTAGWVGTEGLWHALGVLHRVVPLWLLVGYSKRDGSDPLENATRATIYELVRETPGTYYARLASEAGVTEETVRYHGRVLEREGLVEQRKLRGRHRLYPVTMDGGDPELAAAMVDPAVAKVLDAIECREPTTLSAIAEAVDCAPSTVSYHLDRLEEDGLIDREREGRTVHIRLHVSTRAGLDESVADD